MAGKTAATKLTAYSTKFVEFDGAVMTLTDGDNAKRVMKDV
jgi:hypothetical protein